MTRNNNNDPDQKTGTVKRVESSQYSLLTDLCDRVFDPFQTREAILDVDVLPEGKGLSIKNHSVIAINEGDKITIENCNAEQNDDTKQKQTKITEIGLSNRLLPLLPSLTLYFILSVISFLIGYAYSIPRLESFTLLVFGIALYYLLKACMIVLVTLTVGEAKLPFGNYPCDIIDTDESDINGESLTSSPA